MLRFQAGITVCFFPEFVSKNSFDNEQAGSTQMQKIFLLNAVNKILSTELLVCKRENLNGAIVTIERAMSPVHPAVSTQDSAITYLPQTSSQSWNPDEVLKKAAGGVGTTQDTMIA